jgi:cytochrome c oxidase subunit 3
MSATTKGVTPYYYVPAPSRHPVMTSIGLFFVILGAGQWVNGHGWGAYALLFGLLWTVFVLRQWFG